MVSLAINHHKHQWNISSTSGESFSHHQLRLTPWPHANCVPWDQLWHLHWWGTALKESIQNISEQLLQKRPRPRHITGYYGHISGATPISRSKICSSQGHWSPDWPCESIHPVFTREISNFEAYQGIPVPEVFVNIGPSEVHPCRVCLTMFRGSSTIFTQSHFGAPLLPWRRGQVWPSRKRSFKLRNSLGLSLDPQHQAESKRRGFN